MRVPLGPIRFPDKSGTEARFVGGPRSGNPPAEYGRAQHRSFQARLAVDMPAGHAGDFPGGVQARDRLEIFVQHTTTEVGLDAAKVFAGQRKQLNRVIGRAVEFFRLLQRFTELRFSLQSSSKALL